jgi:hypothetical protein
MAVPNFFYGAKQIMGVRFVVTGTEPNLGLPGFLKMAAVNGACAWLFPAGLPGISEIAESIAVFDSYLAAEFSIRRIGECRSAKEIKIIPFFDEED